MVFAPPNARAMQTVRQVNAAQVPNATKGVAPALVRSDVPKIAIVRHLNAQPRPPATNNLETTAVTAAKNPPALAHPPAMMTNSALCKAAALGFTIAAPSPKPAFQPLKHVPRSALKIAIALSPNAAQTSGASKNIRPILAALAYSDTPVHAP
jgi:hypothetical protein